MSCSALCQAVYLSALGFATSLSPNYIDVHTCLNSVDDASDSTMQRQQAEAALKFKEEMKLVPMPLKVESWQYEEDVAERGILSLFEEVGCIARYVGSLRTEVQSLDFSVMAVQKLLDAAIGPKSTADPVVSKDMKELILAGGGKK